MNYIKNLLFIIVLGIFGYWVLYPKKGLEYNFEILLLSFIIIVVPLFILFYKDKTPFSLNIVTNLFFVFFIGLSPAIQFQHGIYFFGENGKLTENEFKLGNLIFFNIVVLYNIGYLYFQKKWGVGKFANQKRIVNITNSYSEKGIVIIALFSLFVVLSYFQFNFNILISRWYLNKSYLNSNSTLFAIINVFRAAPLILLVYYKMSKNSKLKVELFLLLLIVLLNFPTSIPRYRVAVIYLPVLILYFKPPFKRYVFSVLYVISFIIIFPFLSNFRFKDYTIEFPEMNLNTFKTINFDTFQNTVNVIVNNIITNGEQLIGVLFFFIPRSIWENKPQGSHEVLAKNLNYDGFSNVAISYFGEGYINFGYVGILIFILVLVLFNSWFDKMFWGDKNSHIHVLTSFYLVLIPMIFYLLRGSLLPSFANLVGYFVLAFILNKLVEIKVLKTNNK